jgi:hypothetical protein
MSSYPLIVMRSKPTISVKELFLWKGKTLERSSGSGRFQSIPEELAGTDLNVIRT